MEKYGLLKYPMIQKCNIGDYIQSLAAKQFLPRVDTLVSRENLSEYNGEEINMIMNGWYMHNPQYWPPSKLINPHFVSLHINSLAQKRMLEKEGVEYFQSLNRPIGCRDNHTVELLKSKGIDAYFSGCLTTTLDIKYKSDHKTDDILFVDALYNNNHLGKMLYSKTHFVNGIFSGDFLKLSERKNMLSLIFSKDILSKAKYITHMYSQSKYTEDERFEVAEKYLKLYASAKLVVTSRIHCALPCLALGTPVIFLRNGLGEIESSCRFDGLLNLFNTVNIAKNLKVEANFEFPKEKIQLSALPKNPTHHVEIANKLKESCSKFVANIESLNVSSIG